MATRKPDPELSAADHEIDVDEASPVKPKARHQPGEGVEVNLDDEDDDVDEVTKPEAPASRQEKRRQRKAIIDENERLRQERDEALRTAQQTVGYVQGLTQQLQRPQTPQEDPLVAEEKALQAEMDRLVNESNLLERARGTPEQFADLKRRAWDFDQRKSAHLLKKAGAGQQQGPDANTQARLLLTARYPDLMQDERVFAWAQMEYNKALLEGSPNDWNTRDMVADRARERFGLTPQRRRGGDEDRAMRQKLTGTPKGGTGGPEAKGGVVRLTPKQVEEADEAYPHLPEGKRYARYAKVLQGNKA